MKKNIDSKQNLVINFTENDVRDILKDMEVDKNTNLKSMKLSSASNYLCKYFLQYQKFKKDINEFKQDSQNFKSQMDKEYKELMKFIDSKESLNLKDVFSCIDKFIEIDKKLDKFKSKHNLNKKNKVSKKGLNELPIKEILSAFGDVKEIDTSKIEVTELNPCITKISIPLNKEKLNNFQKESKPKANDFNLFLEEKDFENFKNGEEIKINFDDLPKFSNLVIRKAK